MFTKATLILIFAASIFGCTEGNPGKESGMASNDPKKMKLSVLEIAGQGQTAVHKILGEPAQCEQLERYQSIPASVRTYGPRCTYDHPSVVIQAVFIDGVADWITVTPKEEIQFSDEAFRKIGISAFGPNFQSDLVHRFNGRHGFQEYAMFSKNGAGKQVDYFYLKFRTQ